MFRSTTFFLCLPPPHFLLPPRRAILRASLRTLRSVREKGGRRDGAKRKSPSPVSFHWRKSAPDGERKDARLWSPRSSTKEARLEKSRRRGKATAAEAEEKKSRKKEEAPPPSSYAIRCTYSALSLLPLRSASLSLFLCLRPPRGASMCEVSLCGGGGGGGGRENERDGGEKGGTGMRTGIRQDVSFPSSLSVCLLPVFISRNGSSVCRERRDRGEKPPHVPPPVYVRTSCQGLFACGRQ